MPYKSTCLKCGTITETSKSQWLWGKQRPSCSRCGVTLASRGVRTRQRKRPKSDKPRLKVKPGVIQAQRDMQRVIDVAAEQGVSIDNREVTTARRPTLHVMFNRDGYRLADWWPGTTKIILAGGRHATADSIDDALKMALTVDLRPAVEWRRETVGSS
jgi:hypothetical protein